MVFRRRHSVLARVSLAFCIVLGGSFVVSFAAAAGPIRITAVANLTLRATPSANAPVVAQLVLGTEVTEAGPIGLDKTWIRVRAADGREGWVHAKLTRPLDPEWPWATFDDIIAQRLGRKGDGFRATAELVAFIERVLPEYTNPDGRARIELSRLRALSAALESVPVNGGRRDPYAPWLAARSGEVAYDEPGGRWMLANVPVWNLHARHSATSVADDIAWFAVTNGLTGECEGYLPCYLDARNRLQGEYLRRHPDGRRAAEAVGAIAHTAEALAAPTVQQAAYSFDTQKDCQAVLASLDALAAAVQSARVASRDDALTRLATLRRACQ